MRTSAGILLYRIISGTPEFFLVHPGGPFWKNKDAGAWSIPKGELNKDEDSLQAALREFAEETGTRLTGAAASLTPIKQKSGKIVHAWAIEGDIDPTTILSNTFEMEWPPKSGKRIQLPEVDRADWFNLSEAEEKINSAQVPLLNELHERIQINQKRTH